MKGVLGFFLSLILAMSASSAVRKGVVGLTLRFATEVAENQQHGMLSLGKFSRKLTAR